MARAASLKSTRGHDLGRGAANLLVDCVGLQRGQRLLVVREPPGQGHYDETAPDAVEDEARRLGAEVVSITAGLIRDPSEFPGHVTEAMANVDHVVFLNRIGDYARFTGLPTEATKTQCYALDQGMLGSSFATLPHALMTELLRRLERELMAAKTWRITCPLGSDVSGGFCWPSRSGGADDEFAMRLFPVTTFKPVPCGTATGIVALSRWLMPGGAVRVGPAVLPFEGVVLAEVEQGAVRDLRGDADAVKVVRGHYERVSQALGVNRDRVHSWHAGINPRTAFPGPADADPERWGGVSFGSPRYLHFHTCGDEPPGEISWSLFDASVWVDGEAYWRNGELVWLHRQDNRELVSRYAGADCLLERSCGIGL